MCNGSFYNPGEEGKITGSGVSLEPDFKLVETWERRTPRVVGELSVNAKASNISSKCYSSLLAHGI